jgi:phosphate transport system substrate-binding protein
MKKAVIGWTVAVLLSAGLFGGCNGGEQIVISGSSSVVPVAQALAAEYEKENNVRIVIRMSSSGAGIADTQNALNDIGLSSRVLKESEEGVEQTILCYDGIALVVGKESNALDVTTEQVRQLFSEGTAIGEQGITSGVGRDVGSGTRSAFDEIVGIEGQYHSSISTLAETGNVIEAVAPTTSTLAYISYGSLNDKVKALSFNGVACSVENIKNNSYQLQRPFILVTGKGGLSKAAQDFYDYMLSDEARTVMENLSYIPARGL